jgi:hypothetical protein
MNYEKISYIIFLLLIILASLVVYYVFGKGTSKSEGMFNIGNDITAILPLPGATYSGENPNNGKGFNASRGYSKVDLGNNVFKMKATIPKGYIVDPLDNTKLMINPKNDKISQSVLSYKNSTDELLNKGPFEDIPNVKYKTETGKKTPLPTNKKDANGNVIAYYRIKTKENEKNKYVMKPIPDPLPKGYKLDNNNFLIFDTTLYAFSTLDLGFDASDLNVEYKPKDVSDASDNNLGNYYMFDAAGNLIQQELTDASFSPVLYYVPGAYKFGSSNYVPNYEDSVYLSRTTRLHQSSPVFNTAGMLGGFCTQFKNDKFAIEEKCGALDLNTCASTSCCTLIGGQKCVAGNQNGPLNAANYTDYNLKNTDFYYYQGKCYGNCRQ